MVPKGLAQLRDDGHDRYSGGQRSDLKVRLCDYVQLLHGVREDLAKRRKSLGQIHEEMSQAAPVRDAHLALAADEMKVIAEVKRSSPSKGALSAIADPAALAEKYQSAYCELNVAG